MDTLELLRGAAGDDGGVAVVVLGGIVVYALGRFLLGDLHDGDGGSGGHWFRGDGDGDGGDGGD